MKEIGRQKKGARQRYIQELPDEINGIRVNKSSEFISNERLAHLKNIIVNAIFPLLFNLEENPS